MYLSRFTQLQRQMSDGLVRIGRGKTVIPLRIRNPDRSALIRKLWDDRIRTTYTKATTNYNPQEKRMADSYCEALLPFRDDQDLRFDYVNSYGGIRFGKILEDLDAMAATVAYLHCGQSGMGDFPMTILTASVDRIVLHGKMPADANLRLRGMVTWVGYSSMEVSLGVDREDFDCNKYVQTAMARFIMVARSQDGKQSVPVNTLSLTDGDEKKIFEAGTQAALARKHNKSMKTQPPSAEEGRILHSIFLEKHKTTFTPIKSTMIKAVKVCHPQERNLHDLVFGGILMREAFELAYAATSIYCRGRPLFLAIDELAFVHPVPIGSILELTAMIVYTKLLDDQSIVMHVQVIADVINVGTTERVTTNTFHLTFKHIPEREADNHNHNHHRHHPPPPVLPDTYEEGVMYIEGMRRLQTAATDSRPSPFDLVSL